MYSRDESKFVSAGHVSSITISFSPCCRTISGILPENSPFGDGNPRCKESTYIQKLLANFGFKCSVIENNIESVSPSITI